MKTVLILKLQQQCQNTPLVLASGSRCLSQRMRGSKLTPRLFRNTFKDERGHKICPLLESAVQCVGSCITNTALRTVQCTVAQCTLHWGLHSVHCTHAMITTVSEDFTHWKPAQSVDFNLFYPDPDKPLKEGSLHTFFVVVSQIRHISDKWNYYARGITNRLKRDSYRL